MPQKILIIGYGYWGTICAKKLKGYNLTTLNSKNYNEVFDLDINSFTLIIIASPNNTHLSILKNIEELNFKNKVFCEKPLCENYQNALEYLKRTPLNLFISKVWLFNTNYLKLKQIETNDIDTLEIKTNNPLSKGKILFDLVYHDIYMVLDFFKTFEVTNIEIARSSDEISNIHFSIQSIQIRLIYSRTNKVLKDKKVNLYHSFNDLFETINFNYNPNEPDAVQSMFEFYLNCNNTNSYNHNLSLATLKILADISNLND